MKNKKSVARVIALLLTVTLLSGCGSKKESNDAETKVDQPVVEQSETDQPAVQNPPVTERPDLSPEEGTPGKADKRTFPLLDGSTSATPLEAGLRATYQNIPYAEALSQVSHTTTHQSFDRLLAGEVDMIFTVPISEEQRQKAAKIGMELVEEPVAREGFVFVVNANNPVDKLTKEQIQKIYSGEITNWSEVGGNDAKILAYQRNQDSGSQNYMTEFMGDIPLMKPDEIAVPASMSGMMIAITGYDNAENAIGYSVYSYAAQMYANRDEVKFIAVDGIEPTKNTMADGTYPLLSCTYIMYPANHERVSEIKSIVDWMTSEEGQLAVLACGYTPVSDMEIPEYYLPYEAVGTGPKKPADYAPSELIDRIYLGDNSGFKLELEDCTITDESNGQELNYRKLTGFKLTSLSDTALQDEINAKIANMIQRLEQWGLEHPENIAESVSASFEGYDKDYKVEIINGYLSITIGYLCDLKYYGVDAYFLPIRFTHYSECETLCYDLIGKKEITNLSDLFYQGVDVDKLLNNSLSKNIAAYYSEDQAINIDVLRGVDFIGLLGEQTRFSLSEVWFPEESPYFRIPIMFYFDDYKIRDDCILYQYRDCSTCFIKGIKIYTSDVDQYEYDREKIGDVWYTTVVDSRFHSKAEVEAQNQTYLTIQKRADEISGNHMGWEIEENKKSFFLIGDRVSVEGGFMYFRKASLEPITISEMLRDGWKDAATRDSDYPENNFLMDDLYSQYYYYIGKPGENTTTVYLYTENLFAYSYSIPNEYINFSLVE